MAPLGSGRTPYLTLRRIAAAISIQLSYGRAYPAYRTWDCSGSL
jgi:hypothetical protein